MFGVVFGVVHWLVTRWAFDGATLRIETGLLRRDSQQLPVARIQAVDLVQPFLARVLGLAELRIRVAGAKSAHHLSYLAEPVATDLRARLLAAHHGLDQSVPEPDEQPVAVIPTGRLLGSVLLSAHHAGSAGLRGRPGRAQHGLDRGGGRGGGIAGRLPDRDRPRDLAPLQRAIPASPWRWRPTASASGAACSARCRRPSRSAASRPCARSSPCCGAPSGGAGSRSTWPGLPGHGRSGGRGRVTKALLPVGPRADGRVTCARS